MLEETGFLVLVFETIFLLLDDAFSFIKSVA